MSILQDLCNDIYTFQRTRIHPKWLDDFKQLYARFAGRSRPTDEQMTRVFGRETLELADELYLARPSHDPAIRVTLLTISEGSGGGPGTRYLPGYAPPWRLFLDFGEFTLDFACALLDLLERHTYADVVREILRQGAKQNRIGSYISDDVRCAKAALPPAPSCVLRPRTHEKTSNQESEQQAIATPLETATLRSPTDATVAGQDQRQDGGHDKTEEGMGRTVVQQGLGKRPDENNLPATVIGEHLQTSIRRVDDIDSGHVQAQMPEEHSYNMGVPPTQTFLPQHAQSKTSHGDVALDSKASEAADISTTRVGTGGPENHDTSQSSSSPKPMTVPLEQRKVKETQRERLWRKMQHFQRDREGFQRDRLWRRLDLLRWKLNLPPNTRPSLPEHPELSLLDSDSKRKHGMAELTPTAPTFDSGPTPFGMSSPSKKCNLGQAAERSQESQ